MTCLRAAIDGQLAREVYDGSGTANDRAASYAYDLANNRLAKLVDDGSDDTIDETIDYTYDERNELLAEDSDVAGTTTYAYDDNGSQTDKIHGSDHVVNTYDLRGKLAGVDTDNDSVNEIVDAYDYQGNRVAETVDSVETVYLIDQQNATGYSQVIEEKAASGSVEVSYVAGLDLVSQYVASASEPTSFFAYDGLGSTRFLTGPTGAIVTGSRAAYDAFGDAIGTPVVITSIGYRGERYDSDTGTYYFRARDYDPRTGLLPTTDPIWDYTMSPIGFNSHLYAGANPTNCSDPSGMIFIGSGVLRMMKAMGVVLAFRVLVGIRATYVIGRDYQRTVNPAAYVNQWIGRTGDDDLPPSGWETAFRDRPDILDVKNSTIYEIKSDLTAGKGFSDIAYYLPLVSRRYQKPFRGGSWPACQRTYTILGLPGILDLPKVSISITARNIGPGVIKYDISPCPEILALIVQAYDIAWRGKAIDAARTQAQTATATLLGLLSITTLVL